MKLISLREARRRRRWTQEQLAAASGVDQTTISRLEIAPKSNPTYDTVTRLAEALGIAPSRLRFSEPQPDGNMDELSDSAGHQREAAKAS